ncbi:NADH-ubiquinone oxidoreductase-F iron-sulfur binding region domain-containing protein [Spongisporangium articulatum]|uniref:NADH-ubiquinone oxidoreductase-F iron-sulfur binding region domain-containing protein n=1 Tax=Spongisporangium articulatum TaxID=3362603 RepID=A0ABW8ASF3_9ACTN
MTTAVDTAATHATGWLLLPGPAPRLLAARPGRVTARPDLTRLLDLLQTAGLTGRGGAGFPTARKLAGVAAQSRRPAVVVNAMEGEPLARKDEALLYHAPDLVVAGADILATALGARRVVLGVGEQIATTALEDELARHRRRIEFRSVPDGFVSGQESALVAALDGRPAVPTDPAVPVWQRGLDGRPTLVVNAETSAQLALLVQHGAAWFRQAGRPDDPGTFLLSVTGSSREVVADGVTEADRGTAVGEVLARLHLRPDLLGGVLVGGYHGAWLPPSALGTPLDRSSLAPWHASTGAGVLHVLDRRHCPVEATARIVAYLAGQSARQCGPCVNGLPRLATTLGDLAAAPNTAPNDAPRAALDPHLPARVEHLAALVEGRGACAHPDGTVRLVRSLMRTFAPHVRAHLDGSCPL